MSGRIKKHNKQSPKTLAAIMAGLNGLSMATPMALPLATVWAEKHAPQQEVGSNPWQSSEALFNRLFFTTAYAATIDTDTTVKAGEVADSDVIVDGGCQNVYGSATHTTINSGGTQQISAGGSAGSTIINSGGTQVVNVHGVAIDTVVNNGGVQQIAAGGSAIGTVLEPAGILYNRGSITDTVVYDGIVNISGGSSTHTILNEFGTEDVVQGNASGTIINHGGQQRVSTLGQADGTVINGGGRQSIIGKANSTIVNAGGMQYVDVGGQADGTVVNGGGMQAVQSSGQVTNGIIHAGGSLQLTSGSSATNMDLQAGSILFATTDAELSTKDASQSIHAKTADHILLTTSGSMLDVLADGTAGNTTVASGGRLRIEAGGKALDTVLQAGYILEATTSSTLTTKDGSMSITPGAVDAVTLHSGSTLIVLTGTQASHTTVTSGGCLSIAEAGKALATTLQAGYLLDVNTRSVLMGVDDKGRAVTINDTAATANLAQNVTLNKDSRLAVLPEGTVNNTTVNSGGRLTILAGGKALNTSLQAGYILQADTDAYLEGTDAQGQAISIKDKTAANLTIGGAGATLNVLATGTANNTTINSGGQQNAKGIANNTIINDGGLQTVETGSQVSGTVINQGGQMTFTDGVVTDTTINPGGRLAMAWQRELGGITRLSGAAIYLGLDEGTGNNQVAINDLRSQNGAIVFASSRPTNQLNISSLTGNTAFLIATDLANHQADQIHIAASAGGQHQLAVQSDPCYRSGTSVTGDAVFATVPDSNTTFTAEYFDVGAYRYLPVLSVDADGRTWHITGIKAEGVSQTLYTALDSSAGDLALLTESHNNLTKRMGDLRHSQGEAGDWARFYRGRKELNNPANGTSTTLQYNALQGGHDTKNVSKDGTWYHGYALSYLSQQGSETRGSSDGDSYNAGVYASWLGNKGHYLDLIGKLGTQNTAYSSYLNNSLGTKVNGSYETRTSSLSAEYGYRKFITPQFYLEPQAELNVAHMGGADYTASAGTAVRNHSTNSVIGRLGLEIGGQNKTTTYYLKTSLVREFAASPTVTMASRGYAPITLEQSLKQSWWEFNLGLTGKLSKKTDGYLELTHTTGDAMRTPWQVNAGLRVGF